MQFIGSSPRCACGRHYVTSTPTDHLCTGTTTGNGPFVIGGSNRADAVSPEIREFEEACERELQQREATRRANNRERRRFWREQAAKEFARGPRR